MTLLVEHPPGFGPEREYVHDVVLSELLGLTYRAREAVGADVRISLAEESDGQAVVIPDVLFALSQARWLTPGSLPALPLARASLGGAMDSELPILFGRPLPGGWAQSSGSDGVRIAVDVFGSAFFMLARYEEVVSAERDEHERFPAAASVSSKEGILQRPIVNEYAELLWSALQRLWPRLRRGERTFEVRLTHDVDHPSATKGVPTKAVLRTAAGDVIRRGEPGVAVARLRSLAAVRRGRSAADPYDTFEFLASTSERHGVHSAFYFMAHDAAKNDFDPPPLLDDAQVGRVMRRLHDRGHEIGLHPSYGTFRHADRIGRELSRLREAAGRLGIEQDGWGGRQHYLRWENPTTWRNWDQAGLAYDSTVGYAEALGFRTGVCHEHAVFDVHGRTKLRVRELPLHAMDVTLFERLGLSHDAAREQVLDLARTCRRYGGQLVLLWHNNTVASRRAQDWYRALVSEIAD